MNDTAATNATVNEEWFLENLEADPQPVDALADAVFVLKAEHGAERAWAWAELLAEKWAEAKQGAALLALLQRWCDKEGETPALRQACPKLLKQALDKTWGGAWIRSAGFDKPIPLAEALRRLDLLMALQPGTLCHDNTWGFGVVQRTDDFYDKVVIDFERRTGHEMALGYAAETLDLIGPDHLMAKRHTDPEGVAELAKTRPDELVKIAVRSYGPMNVPALQDRLCDGLVQPSDWKRFWDQARKTLKADKRVQMPARRADPVVLLDKEKSYEDAWFSDLAACTDIDSIHRRLTELIDESDRRDWTENERRILADRLAFGMTGAESRRRDLMAQFAVQAERLSLDPAMIGNGLLNKFFTRDYMLPALARLPARDMGAFLKILYARDSAACLDLLSAILPDTTNQAVNSIMALLLEEGQRDALAARFRKIIAGNAPSPVVLAWMARHFGALADWNLVSAQDFLALLIACLQRRCAGEELKAQNLIRGLMEKTDWLGERMAAMTPEGRADILARVRDASEWDLSSRREVMALMIGHDPELERVMTEEKKPDETDAPAAATARFTSVRSYRERARQYKRLIETDIPANSRDIGVARSYGDLRENAEYESAKQQQGLLMKRKAEMEQDLAAVRETNFEDFPSERAGMGTCVTVETDGNRTLEYAILGEWDRDETLNIVSSQSLVARTLEGLRPGDKVLLPGDPDKIPGRIVAVDPLSDAVKQWVNTTATA